MVVTALRIGVLLAAGGLAVLGGGFVHHLSAADLHAFLQHAHDADLDGLRARIALEAEAALAEQRKALLDAVERAASKVVDAAAAELKAQVDQAAADAKLRVHEKLHRAKPDVRREDLLKEPPSKSPLAAEPKAPEPKASEPKASDTVSAPGATLARASD